MQYEHDPRAPEPETDKRDRLREFGDLLFQDILGLDRLERETVIDFLLRALARAESPPTSAADNPSSPATDPEPFGLENPRLQGSIRAVSLLAGLTSDERKVVEQHLHHYLAELHRSSY